MQPFKIKKVFSPRDYAMFESATQGTRYVALAQQHAVSATLVRGIMLKMAIEFLKHERLTKDTTLKWTITPAELHADRALWLQRMQAYRDALSTQGAIVFTPLPPP